MPRKGHTEEPIIRALREAESGKKVGDICREMGVSPQAFYSWKRRFAGLGLTELRELRQLREENRKLKTLVADLTLDKPILQEVLKKERKACSPSTAGQRDTAGIPRVLLGNAGIVMAGEQALAVDALGPSGPG